MKNELNLSFTYHHETKDELQNFSIEEGLKQIQLHLLEDFKSANLLLTDKNMALEISCPKCTLRIDALLLDDHIANCTYVSCEYCSEFYPTEWLEEHKKYIYCVLFGF